MDFVIFFSSLRSQYGNLKLEKIDSQFRDAYLI